MGKLYDSNTCPVCSSDEGFYIQASGSEWADLTSYGIGSVDLIACARCGCVYASTRNRRDYRKLQEERGSRGGS